MVMSWIVTFLILGTASAFTMLLHGIRWWQWRSAVFLALAGVASGFLVVIAKFEPIQHAIFPFRYDTQDIEAGATYSGGPLRGPYNAPKWLTSLAEHGQIVQTPSDGVMGPSYLPGVAYYNPNFVCGVPGTEPREPSTAPGVISYTGSRAVFYYAFRSDQNALLRGAFLLLYYSAASTVVYVCLRRLLRSARRGGALARVDRASILVHAAWWSIAWPAAAVLAHAFFFELYRASYYWDGAVLTLQILPLALGRAGIGAIWLGAVLGSILTFYCVAIRAAARLADSSDAEAICDACGYPVTDPHDRCPECGTPREAGTPNSGKWWKRTHMPVMAALWVLVGLLLCAPLTLPLLGALLPSPVVDAIGQSWYQLPWVIEREVVLFP